MLPRADTTDFGSHNGKDAVTKVVRAASKPGAMLTARVDAIQNIPFRSQEIVEVENLDNNRLLNKWRVLIRDRQELENIGR